MIFPMRLEPLEPRTLFTTLPIGYIDRTIVTGLTASTAETVALDGRLFVCEKDGTLRVIQNGRLLSTPFLSLSVDTFSERGLDGVALDPNFATNGFVYVYYTTSDPAHLDSQNDRFIHNRLSRFTVSAGNPNVADPSSEVVLLDNIPSTQGNHNGGSMQFGRDGMLYLGIGDSGISSNAQNLNNLNGKILRLNVENPSNIIPSDNPFVGRARIRSEIWAYGFRNPFTSAVQPGTGTIFVNDVGSSGSAAREEVDVLQKGADYGWPIVEGIVHRRGFTDPIYTYKHNGHGSGAITGGVFYTGRSLGRKFNGKYLFSDYIQEFIGVLDPKTGAVSKFATGADTLIDLDEAPDGGIYYLSAGGSVHEISLA